MWFGGKGNMRAKLLPLFPPHHTYVEPFGGAASMLFGKKPSPVEVYNDLDSGLVEFFRALRDPEQAKELQRLASLTPYAREEYDYCRAHWQEETDPVRRAWQWFVVARMSFGGHFGHSWGSVVTLSRSGKAATASPWLSAIKGLPEAHERLMRVQIEHQDWQTILERYDTPETLFYCDPPYVHSTRSSGKYDHEMTDEDHEMFIAKLLETEGMAVVSGYEHPIYRALDDADWKRYEWQTVSFAAAKTRATGIQGKGSALRMQPRTEVAWVKPWAIERLPLFANGR